MAKAKKTKPVPKRYVQLPGSERKPAKGAVRTGDANPKEKLTVSIVLRRKPGAPPLPDQDYWKKQPPGKKQLYTRQEFAELFGASQDDINKIVAFAAANDLAVVESSIPRRTVVLSGTVEQMQKAFNVNLGKYRLGEETYRGREGHVQLPADLVEIVQGVFGLDNRKMAKRNDVPGASTTTPVQVASLYNFPTNSAAGQTIGILEFGGGYAPADIQTFFTGLGLTTPTLTDVSVDMATNSPDFIDDGEVALDIEVAGAVAQGANIAVYFTPWTEQGWIDAVTTAIHDTTNNPSVLSISWGWAENETVLGLTWTTAAINAVDVAFQEAASLGVTVFVASGDAGSDDAIGDGKAHVDFPSSDPWVTGCGGTVITDISGSSFNEGTWNDDIGATGGGISDVFPVPSWQSTVTLPSSVNSPHNRGRGVPDIAGNASPYSGYNIDVDGGEQDGTGGTSAVAPLYAGLTAVINAAIGQPIGYLNPTLYNLAGTNVFRDINDGVSNGYNGAPGYTAGAGWDACTGLGVIRGNEFLDTLRSVFNRNMYFIVDKSTFGSDEVSDVISTGGGLFSNAFWVVLEGFSINQVAGVLPTLSGAFDSIPGITIFPDSAGPHYELPGDLFTPQRIRFPYDIIFSSTALSAFPAAGTAPVTDVLVASVNINGSMVAAEALFELAGGKDPYFTNIDAANNNVFYLSQDLRVFYGSEGQAILPGAPALTNDPYQSIQNLLGFLNSNSLYTTPGADPLNALPGQSGYETGDSSVTPLNGAGSKNYNFAIARVRLQDAALATADNVRVFFRLFVAQSCDTDFQPATTYKSTLGTSGLDNGKPVFPLASGTGLMDSSGNTIQTIPFFATDTNGTHDYDSSVSNGNIRNIQIPGGRDKVWAYYGCFLDVYDASNQSKFPGTHHCIIAEIANDDTPIINSGGVTMSPENSDKLAQRNLEITSSGNPSYPDTHRIPQTFDLRPSGFISAQSGLLQDYADELMIDWGNVPAGSISSIYWPQVSATDVLQLATKMYGIHHLSASDPNTIQCATTKGVTYVPIPYASGKNFAGLITVDLPNGIHVGQEFNITVRRVSSRKINQDVLKINTRPEGGGFGNQHFMRNWRYITGTFQIKIPVGTDESLLWAEENTLAILKWRLEHMSPVYRWYPVLQRYIQYISNRVNGFGGNAANIPPSITGVPIIRPKECCSDKFQYTGKVCQIVYDCFGDFEGFTLCNCCGEQVFKTREKGIAEIALRACRDRLPVSVYADEKNRTKICKIIVRC